MDINTPADENTTYPELPKAGQERPNPNELLHIFLKANNLKLKVTTFDAGDNPFINDGFILTEKPLLKIEVQYEL